MLQDIVVTRDLSKSYGRARAVDGLNMRVAAGQIYGLVGPDGAGKTTTLRLLCGALPPDTGSALVAGFDVAGELERVRQQIGYMPQRFSLYGDLTVRENMRFVAEVYGVPQAEQVTLTQRLLEFSGLGQFQNRRADALSGGMKQKLALACALIHRPSLLMLDEPTTGVDPVARREFWDLLREAVGQHGTTVLVSTPYMDEADRCHTVSFMRAGKLLASGTPRELQALVPGVVLEVRASSLHETRRVLRTIPGVRDAQVFGDRLHVLADSALAAERIRVAAAAAGAELHTLRPVPPAMEDVFMHLQRSSAQ